MMLDASVSIQYRAPQEVRLKRDKTIIIRVTEAERDAIKAKAKRLGITVSELLRRAADD